MKIDINQPEAQHIHVELMDNMGNDNSVVNAARVSFNKTCCQFTPEQNEKLIKYLADHKHEIPFAHTAITLRVRAPISIRTQCFKHKVGFVENEISRRYVKDRPTYFLPEFRFTPDKSIKQGSAEVIEKTYIKEILKFKDVPLKAEDFLGKEILFGKTQEELDEKFKSWESTKEDDVYYYFNDETFSQDALQKSYQAFVDASIVSYEEMIAYGISPEQARFILPQGIMTEWVWTGSLLAFARFVNLRKSPAAQKEVKEVADFASKVIEPLYPVSWKALTDGD